MWGQPGTDLEFKHADRGIPTEGGIPTGEGPLCGASDYRLGEEGVSSEKVAFCVELHPKWLREGHLCSKVGCHGGSELRWGNKVTLHIHGGGHGCLACL